MASGRTESTSKKDAPDPDAEEPTVSERLFAQVQEEQGPFRGSSESVVLAAVSTKGADDAFVLKAALLGCVKSGYKQVLDMAQLALPGEHQWQIFRHKIFDIMGETERNMRTIIARINEGDKG